MAFEIHNNMISLCRGDSFMTEVAISYEDGTPYTPSGTDKLRFALKSNKMVRGNIEFLDPKPLILKDIPIDTMILQLDPEDTKGLPFGQYKYDIELTYSNDLVCTVIEDEIFRITPEVY